jgi:hypothetical protein
MTFEQLENTLPNGFHDAQLFGIRLDYVAASLTLEMNILISTIGGNVYSPAIVEVKGLCVCTIEPPDPRYHFLPDGTPLNVSGNMPKKLGEELLKLSSQFPARISWYRFFVEEWNSFINIASDEVSLSWPKGEPPSRSAL